MLQRPYQQLLVWQQAHALCLSIYKDTKSFPSDERWRLVDQICRAASSVPTNIAEGNAKRSFKEKRKYFEIALASLDETHYHCLLAKDLQYFSQDKFVLFAEQVKSINILLTRLRESFKE